MNLMNVIIVNGNNVIAIYQSYHFSIRQIRLFFSETNRLQKQFPLCYDNMYHFCQYPHVASFRNIIYH